MNFMVRNLALACVAAGIFTTGAYAADAAAGKTLFAAKCKNCHGADGTPSAGMVKAFGTIKPMNDPAVQGKSDGNLKDAVIKGSGKMKAQAVSAGEAENLIAYIRTMK